jgi:hypothetical protein
VLFHLFLCLVQTDVIFRPRVLGALELERLFICAAARWCKSGTEATLKSPIKSLKPIKPHK